MAKKKPTKVDGDVLVEVNAGRDADVDVLCDVVPEPRESGKPKEKNARLRKAISSAFSALKGLLWFLK